MPHPKSKKVCRTTPVRLLAIFTATLLSVPSVPAERQDARDQIRPESLDAVSFSQDARAQAAASLPQPQQKRPNYTDLACAGSELNEGYVLPTFRNPEAGRWGDISIAQPKIWQFERVSALLDGLLRDVEGVSLGDLTQLDPSQQNAAALKFIQSALEVGVQYDQAAAVNAANTLGNYNELHASQTQQLQQYNNYMQTLTSERDRLAAQYAASSNEVNALTALKAAGPLTDAQNKQLEEAVSKQATTQASLASVNSLISGAGAAPTLTAPPTVTGTSVQGPASGSPMASSLSGFSDVLKNLPDGVQKNLSAALQSPSYPATKRLDNFITLLYERLAREISVLQDDLTRDPENVAFLLQFDVGLYPSKKAKDHVARVEFNLDCPGCKVYSLYPGQSSYNLANYSGASKRTTLWGNALTLLGFGVSASYRRQTDTLQGSLVQSVYTSGFQNGVLSEPNGSQIHTGDRVDANRAEQSFGWYYGAAPFEQVVTPGIRTTFAMITVPRSLIRRSQDRFGNTNACIPFHIGAGWSNRNDPLAQNSYTSPAGRVLKQARVPFYIPHRNELESNSQPHSGDNSNPKCDPRVPCNPNSNPTELQSPPCCTIRPETTNASVLKAETSVKLPGSLDGYSLVGARESKLHVVRMEYDTVYEDPAYVSSATSVQTMIQTSTQSTNPVTGQTAGQTTTQSTGSSVAVSNSSKAPSAPDASAALNPLPCPRLKCAPVLLKLDHPIDPNLTVTVRGNPLQRVRDWRGRATSVLPPAQSGTDLSGAAATSGSLSLKQLAQTRGLLEIDQFGPNTWFPLNSHELLLNISIDVATEYEFPVIQLSDPSGTVVIPHDLRRSFTELIVNNFRMRPETEHGIQTEVARQNWRDTADSSLCPNGATSPGCFRFVDDAPISTGMYPFSTYSPLFSHQPEARDFFGFIGETGEDLLILFLPRTPEQKATDKTAHFDWQSALTRVILEDRGQDFAWSLSCDVQGSLLSCRIPRSEIRNVYQNFLRACPDSFACPGIEEEYRSLMQSLTMTSEFLASADPLRHKTVVPAAAERNRVQEGSLTRIKASLDETPAFFLGGSQETDAARVRIAEEKAGQTAETARVELLKKQNLQEFRNAFLKTMQLWVEQFDEEGKNVFYSPEPVSLNFFPLSDDYWRDAPFTPWDFESADADRVTLRECNYLPQIVGPHGQQSSTQEEIYVELLGVPSWKNWLHPRKSVETPNAVANQPSWTYPDNEANSFGHCGTLSLPTSALANNPIVFQMEFPPHLNPKIPRGRAESNAAVQLSRPDSTAKTSDTSLPIRTTVAIPRYRLAPHFMESEIQVHDNVELTSGAGKVAANKKVWKIVIPVERSTCFDTLDLDPELLRRTNIRFEWRNGKTPLATCPGNADAESKWQNAAESGRIDLLIEIPHSAIRDLPESIHLIRTTRDGVGWEVASLPNLRRLLLPSRATIRSLSPTMFAIVGDHAEVIDHVAVRNTADDTTGDTDTIPGRDYALVSFPAPSSSGNTNPDTSGNSPGGTNSTNINITTTKDQAATVKLTQNSSTSAKPAATPPPAAKTPSAADSKPAPAKLTPGTYAVVSMMQVRVDPASQEKIQAMVKAEQGAYTAIAKANAAKKQADASASALAKAQAAAKKDAGKPPATPAPSPSPTPGAAPPATTPPAAAPPANAATPENKAKPATSEKQAAPSPAKGGAAGQNPGGAGQPQTSPPAKGAPVPKSPEQVLADKAAADKKAADAAIQDADKKIKAAEDAEAEVKKGTPIYMPLDITDKDGNPLTFTIPDTKKSAAAPSVTPAAAITTCVAPCAGLTCAVTCPPPATPASPKTP
jgi:hypothetical protein